MLSDGATVIRTSKWEIRAVNYIILMIIDHHVGPVQEAYKS